MTDTTIVAVPPAPAPSYVEWGPIIGGALLASALSFVLFAFGSAAGFASVSPYSWNNPSATTLSIIAVAWVLVVMIGSCLAGGYFAGRFRRPAGEFITDERELRDAAHGLLVWALTMVIGVALGVMATIATVRSAATVVGAGGVAAASNSQVTGFVDTLLRPGPQNTAPDNPATREEVTRILGNVFTRGEINNDDRTYIARIVASRSGISEDEARKRVDTTIEQAKQAADNARKMAAILAFLIGAASILAAGAAAWAAKAAGQQRDESLVGSI